MKKQVKVLLIAALCMLMALSFGMLAACKDDPQTAKSITVTVNLNMDGAANQTFTVDKGEDGTADFYSRLAGYLPQDTSGLTFAGWRDASGAEITSQTRWDKDGTATAQWNASYVTEYYLETDDGFVKSDEHTSTKTALVGSTVVGDQIAIEGYSFDASNSLNVKSATLKAGVVLKLYYKRATVTVTFNANNPDATGAMEQQSVPYGTATKLAANGFKWKSSVGADFGGWNTQANGLGDGYTDECDVTLTQDLTLYAQWKISYKEQIWVEKLVENEYVYELFKEVDITNKCLGNSVTVQTELSASDYQTLGHGHYFLDETKNSSDKEWSKDFINENDTLYAYYSLERFNVFYVDDSKIDVVRYGETYSIRTPQEDPDSHVVTVTYSTSETGYGSDYPFGKEVTLNADLHLYPVYAPVFTDADGSGDRVVIRIALDGLGSAKLIKNGVGYLGFAEVAENVVTFTVTVDGSEIHGKLFADDTFLYRNEEELGVYLLGDPLFPEEGVSASVMLTLDGYGIGVLAEATTDGTDRTKSYFVNYEATEEGDYYMEFYLPATPNDVHNGYFKLVRTPIEGAEDMPNVVGYFLLCGSEYGQYTLVYNGDLNDKFGLFLNGYGTGYYTAIEGEASADIEGTYFASQNYTDEAPEYDFISLDEQTSFTFILLSEQNPSTGEDVYFFMQKHDEEGDYRASADASYPVLTLDGYGMALYLDVEGGDERWGSYKLSKDAENNYKIDVEFADAVGGFMRVILNRENNTYAPNPDEFEIDENGVLTKYYGSSSVIVIPDDVTEIADEAFKDVNVTTVTLPASLQKIGKWAFQNSSGGGSRSMLKTVYLNAVTPPSLGEDPFRWVTSEFKVIVPNDALEAYRSNASWKAAAPSLTDYVQTCYADFVTSQFELDNKPLYEVKNGVLVSYNNKDENPQNVSVVIPDEVTEIAAHVFEGRSYITSVNLNNVTVIGESAFDGCTNLASVTFNAATASIGNYAFFECLGLTEINLGNVQTIGNGAFAKCFNLTNVEIGSGIQNIGSQAFAYCAVEVDETENVSKQNELVLSVTATSAPAMGVNVFQGCAARIYVDSFATGVSFANSESWTLYARHLRVRNANTQTLYSLSNMGAILELGDNAVFDSSRSGLYQWSADGAKLEIAWFDRDEFTNNLTVLRQVGEYNQSTGLIRGFNMSDNTPLVLVVAGTVVNYANGDEALTVTFGGSAATFNGSDVTIDIVNYRMQFNYDGYVYHLTLANDRTFTYTRNKIRTEKTYTATDGSEIKVVFGDSIQVFGTIVNGDGSDAFPYTTEIGWYATNEDDGSYTWNIPWRNDRYKVTAIFNDTNGTFTYTVDKFATGVTYKNGQDSVVVTTYASGAVDMLFSFNTSNGTLNCKCSNVQAVDGTDNQYVVTIAILIEIPDGDGNVIEVPSEFDGTYRITLNSDNTYVLTKITQ